jgi:carbamoyltransferase
MSKTRAGSVLGISAFFHDSAAALLVDGAILAAAQEERFTRIRHDAAFPSQAIRYCLSAAGLSLSEVEHIVFFEKPFLKFERLLETYLNFAPRGFVSFAKAMPVWISEKLFQKRVLWDALAEIDPAFDAPIRFAEHHYSHAASAFFPSPFDQALVLTMDGVGEWATTTAAIGHGNTLEIIKEIRFPHSLGLLYSAFTGFLGFKVNSGEYKMMGLAPYGAPRFAERISSTLIDLKDDGSFRLDMRYFDYATGLRMINKRFAKLFGMTARSEEEPLAQAHMDLAASIQQVTEEIVLKLARSLQAESQQRNLCLAGGVALNCVANGKLKAAGIFDRIWVQPAASDAGGALGAALAYWYQGLGKPRESGHQGLGMPRESGCQSPRDVEEATDAMQGSYLGPGYSDAEIRAELERQGAVFEELDAPSLIARAAAELAQGKALGWFQGRMEYGPRALGARSILADPRSPAMQSTLNLKVKFREGFRPFAPIVLAEEVSAWFAFEGESPYMLMVAQVLERHRLAVTEEAQGLARARQARSSIPAVTHVDGSARLQTVHARSNPKLHQLLQSFKQLTGVPILVNTSFNVRGEPIVCTPFDAWRCFMGTDLDALAIGSFYLEKRAQPQHLIQHYAESVPRD